MPPSTFHARLRGLYVITDAELGGGHLTIARAALAGGAGILQLRDKSTAPHQLLPIARALRQLTLNAGCLFIINDRLDLAQACGADGVHLGPDDTSLAHARGALGPHALLGASCGTPAEALLAQRNGASYIGAGAVYATGTKLDAGAPIGLAVLREITRITTLPVAGIGGITAANLGEVLQAGAKMACVISAITAAGDEETMTVAARTLVRACDAAVA